MNGAISEESRQRLHAACLKHGLFDELAKHQTRRRKKHKFDAAVYSALGAAIDNGADIADLATVAAELFMTLLPAIPDKRRAVTEGDLLACEIYLSGYHDMEAWNG